MWRNKVQLLSRLFDVSELLSLWPIDERVIVHHSAKIQLHFNPINIRINHPRQ